MDSVVVSDPGVFLGKTSERLVIRGPRPRIEVIEGGPQLALPLSLDPPPGLSIVTSGGVQTPAPPLRRSRASRTTPEQIELPLFRVGEIIVASPGVSLSTDLIEACCERGIRVSILSSTGKPIAMLSSPMLTATVLTRREQMTAYGDERGVDLARAIVRGKLANQAALLKYFGKYQKTVDGEAFATLTAATSGIAALRRDARSVTGACIDEARSSLLAIEGAAGRHYWSGVRTLLQGRLTFDVREHRGATDPVNSALNYGYGILYAQVWGAIMNAGLEPFAGFLHVDSSREASPARCRRSGLEPFAGFLHVDRPGKPSLVLDLVEEFRQPIVDRAVIATVTKGGDLGMRGGMLSDAARRAVAEAVVNRLEGEVAFRGRRHRVKSIVQMQARSVATSLRERTDYRPFAFKW